MRMVSTHYYCCNGFGFNVAGACNLKNWNNIHTESASLPAASGESKSLSLSENWDGTVRICLEFVLQYLRRRPGNVCFLHQMHQQFPGQPISFSICNVRQISLPWIDAELQFQAPARDSVMISWLNCVYFCGFLCLWWYCSFQFLSTWWMLYWRWRRHEEKVKKLMSG